MAHDRELADRIRELITDEPGLSEQRMFGGLAFLVGGNMAVAASGHGGLLVRVDPAESARLVGAAVQPMEMRGRPVKGWLHVDAEGVRTKRQLVRWVDIGIRAARSLPVRPDRRARS